MEALRILVISDYRERVPVRPEAEMFIRMARLGHRVDILTYPGSEYIPDFERAGMRVLTDHPVSRFGRTETRRLRALLIREDYDILHAFNGRAILHSVRAARGLRVRVVLYRGFAGHVHWYDPTAYVKYLHPRVNAVTCITREIREDLSGQYLCRKDPTALVTKGHDPAWYEGIGPADLTGWGVPPDAFVVITVANNRPFKDIPTLLAAACLTGIDPRIYWLVVGRGMDTPENRQRLESHPRPDQVVFTGYLPDPLPYMAASRVIVNSSTGGEGLNKTLIEGMSLGLAPVVTSIAGNLELVPDDRYGILVPPGDPNALAAAIGHLANDPADGRKLGQAAQDRMRTDLHIDRTVEQVLGVYRELLAGV